MKIIGLMFVTDKPVRDNTKDPTYRIFAANTELPLDENPLNALRVSNSLHASSFHGKKLNPVIVHGFTVSVQFIEV